MSGHGLTTSSLPDVYRPLTQYPPLYPILIAASSLVEPSPFQAARRLAGLIAFLNIFGVGAILLRLIPYSIWPAIVGAIFMLLAPVMLEIHLMAWSEPLFILLSLLAFSVLAGYFKRLKKSWLLLAAFLASLTLLTRYAGLAIVATGMLGIILFSRTAFNKRILKAVLYGSISVLPLFLLLIYNQQSIGTATNREIDFHPITRSHFGQGLITFSSWLGVPFQGATWIKVSLVLGFFLFLTFLSILFYRSQSDHEISGSTHNLFPPFVWLLATFIGVYSLFLVISISFLDANTPLDNRILSPFYVCILIITIYVLSTAISSLKTSQSSWLATWLAGIFIFVYAATSIPMIRAYHTTGIGFSTLAWKNSELIELAMELPEPLAIYSNAPEAINLHAARSAASLARVFEQASQQYNLGLAADMNVLGAQMAKGKAVIIFFDQPGRMSKPNISDIQETLNLKIQSQSKDGWIYVLADSSRD